MAEITAFSRRHTPRHSVTTTNPPAPAYSNHYDEITLVSARDRLEALHDGSTGLVVPDPPRSHSKTRKQAAAAATSSTIVKAVVSSTAATRKMSGAQLRVFFLLCVALYFAVICFADDIVRFAQWVGDDDVAAAWKAAIATPTPKPTKATVATLPTDTKRGAEDDKKREETPTNQVNTVADQSTMTPDAAKNHEEPTVSGKPTVEERGNLRGKEAATKNAATIARLAKTEPIAVETPAVLVQKDATAENVAVTTQPPHSTDVQDKTNARNSTAASVPQTPKIKDADGEVSASITGGKKDTNTSFKETTDDDKDAKPLVEKTPGDHVADDVAHKTIDDEQDAPLDSVEERETRVDTDIAQEPTTASTPATIAILAAAAEIPKTAVHASSPKRVSKQATEEEVETIATRPVDSDLDETKLDAT